MTEIRLEKSLPSEQERVGQPSVPAEGLERYFAREGVDPLPYAFEGKIAVHPGLGGSGVEKQDFEATLEPLLAEPRTGKTVAYIHVPFCETHCLYCGFYNKAYREDESRIYADALIQELRLWRGRPGQDAGPVHAVYMGGGTPTALQADDLRRILKEVRAVELERLGRGDVRQPAFHRLHGEAVDEIHDDGGLIIALQKLELPNQRVAIGHAAHRLPDLRVKALHPE